ncbi:ABC transporter ATP-binding protein [Acidipropionibacterium timonense]|uniref:ABC transporter ATP-binding protein n=1 Tax=Acidipropionibacterium timonense TaxID=2161818 RepID=UPI00102FCE2D|nr:ATP-binding cassette domain-containing protein [Acidipropionibacterium timonense]
MTALAVRELSFRYGSRGEELFDHMSHEFDAGAVTALTGPSGRGKSTLLYLLGLMLSPTHGAVLIDGVEAATLPDRRRSTIRAQRIGFVFQDSELDPSRTILDSVLEPTLYAGLERRPSVTRALELLEGFGLAARATHRPGQISGGQAQRVACCRALVNDPQIILADEPTGNLDRDNATVVLDALARAAHDEGATVVIATHDPYVLTRCDGTVSL